MLSPSLELFPAELHWPVAFCALVIVGTYVLSVVTGNLSQVDRVWTFLPAIYTAYFALLPLWPAKPFLPLFPFMPTEIDSRVVKDFSPRALLILLLVTLWMIRLSYNTWRRGLFSLHEEDYRWAVLRKQMSPFMLQFLNLTFIAVGQNIILILLGMPAYYAVSQPHTSLVTSDYILAILAVVTNIVEFTADNQQYSFQTYKRTGVINKNEWPGARIHWTPQDAKRGFVTRGLWAWSRHPNFYCEQGFWVIVTLFPLLSPGDPSFPSYPVVSAKQLYPLLPAIALCSLFYSSTRFSEGISSSKYPGYAVYQERVAMFVPLLTPVLGLVLMLRGKKDAADRVVYGTAKAEKSA